MNYKMNMNTIKNSYLYFLCLLFLVSFTSVIYAAAPVLTFTSESHYATSYIFPEVGKTTNTYTFRVKYTDADNQAPGGHGPLLRIYKGGTEVSYSPMAMGEADITDSNYADGKIYTCDVAFAAGNDYTYQISAYDVTGTSATAITGTGPTVAQSPEMDFVWTRKADLPSKRVGIGTAQVNNKIYCIGGNVGNNTYVAKVEEYDPLSNTWTTKADMPTARGYLSVAAVNNKIYAIGGTQNDVGGYVNTVEEYDPVSNIWTAKTNMPTSRAYASISVINNKIYVLGGYNDAINVNSVVEEYDPLTNLWQTKANLPSVRMNFSSKVINNRIYAIGGYNGIINELSKVEEYNAITDVWVTKANLLVARQSPGIEVINNKIYVFGGSSIPNPIIQSIESYDSINNVWSLAGNTLEAKSNLSVCVVGNKVYIIGGLAGGIQTSIEEGILTNFPTMTYSNETNYTSSYLYPEIGKTTTTYTFHMKYTDADNEDPGGHGPLLRIYKGGTEVSYSPMAMCAADITDSNYVDGKLYTCDVAFAAGSDYTFEISAYDINGASATAITGSGPTVTQSSDMDFLWTRKADMPTARVDFSLESINGKMYVAGGFSSWVVLEEYNPVSNAWTTKEPMPTARIKTCGGVINGKFYVVGGYDTINAYANLQEYSPTSDTWIAKLSMPTARYEAVSAVVNNVLYVIGGNDGQLSNVNCLSNVEAYNPKTNAWSTKTSMPTERFQATAVAVNNRIYVIGGRDSAGPISSVEVYNTLTNTWNTAAALPKGLKGLSALVFNNKIYAIGGTDQGGTYLQNVYEYDIFLDQWTEKNDFVLPTAFQKMTSINNKVYVTGLYNGSSELTVNLYEGTLNCYPSLSKTDQNNYISTYIYPEIGKTTTTYTFHMKYTDADNEDPGGHGPLLRIYKGGTEVSYSPMAMGATDITDTNYVDGKIYACDVAFAAGSDYTFEISAYDINGASATVMTGSGPTVIQSADTDIEWVSKNALPERRNGSGAIVLNGKILLIGGDSQSQVTNSVIQYNETSDDWVAKKSMSVARSGASIALIGEKVYAIGGEFYENDPIPITSIEVFDPSSDQWQIVTNIPTTWAGCAAAKVNSKIYVFGVDSSGSVIEYDVTTSQWKTKSPMLVPKEYFGTAVLNNRIYIIGGRNLTSWDTYSTVEEYNPITDTWTTKSAMFTARTSLSCLTINNKIYAIGGDASLGHRVDIVEEFDPLLNAWSSKNSISIARISPATAVLNGNIYVMGGNTYGLSLDGVEEGKISYINSSTNYVHVDSPTINSLTHPSETKEYLNNNPTFQISTSSGMVGYYYILDQSSCTVPCESSGTYTTSSTISFSSVPDGIWYFHAVAVDDSGNIGIDAAHYKIMIKTTIDPSMPAIFTVDDGTTIDIPSGAVSAATKIEISKPSITAVPQAINNKNLKVSSCLKEIKLSNTAATLLKEITITIPYTDSEISGLDENNLKIAYYDEIKSMWVLINNATVYPDQNKVVFTVDHLTLFRVVEYSAPATSITDLSNYPNPFDAGISKTNIRYTLKDAADIKIRIYDLIGGLVWEKSFSAGITGYTVAGPNEIEWDGKNGAGEMVDMGAYICVVECEGTVLKTKIGVR